MIPARILHVARRFVVMIGGEAMQSAFHFALNLMLVHMLSANDYGLFAIVMVIGGIGLTYIRAFTAMPASIWIGRSHRRDAAYAYDVTFGSGAVLVSAAIGVIVAVLMELWGGSEALLGGAFAGLWSLRSYLRTASFAHGRPLSVALSDLAFTGSGVAMVAGLLIAGVHPLDGTFLALVLANAIGIVVLLLLARRPVRVSLRRSVRRRFGGLWRQLSWSGVSVTTTNVQAQGMALLVAAIAGPGAYAPIAATLVLFVPLRVIATALANMMQPVMAGHLARGETARAWQEALVWTAIMGGGGMIYGAAMMFALPMIRSQVLAGVPLHVIGVFAWALFTATMLSVMPRIVLEIVGAFRAIALIGTFAAVVGLAIVAVVLTVAPPAWSLLGGLVSEVIVMAASWYAARPAFAGRAKGQPALAAALASAIRAAPDRGS